MSDAHVAGSLRVFVKLLRAARAVTAHTEPLLAQYGLTPTQLGVLEAIDHKGPMSQRELGRRVLTSAGNMTDVIDKLAARGLVRRDQGCDRRSVSIVLTDPGRELIGRAFPRHAADIADAMSILTCDELQTLESLLRRLGKGVESE